MKNTEIHIGLENSSLRDFLSLSIIKYYKQEGENKKPVTPYRSKGENAFEYSIKECENEINFQNKKLALLKELQAIITLIKIQGWEEFDVSDETERDPDYHQWMNFIGTQEEYNLFIKNLKN